MNPRNLRRVVARLLVGVLVYAQLAVAAYACMGSSPDAASVNLDGTTAIVGDGGMAQPTHLDPDQPALCVAHCRSGQQTTGAEPLPIPPLALESGYFTLEPAASDTDVHRTRIATAGRAPPMAERPQRILHCCLRI